MDHSGLDDDLQDDLTEGFFRSIVGNSPAAIVVVDATGTIRYVNAAVEELVGYEREDLFGRSLTVLVSDRFPADRAGEVERRLGSGDRLAELREFEFTARRNDGSEFRLSVTVRPHADDGGELYTVLLRDVSARSAHDAERRTFRNAVEHAGHAIYVTDVDGTIEYVNPAFTEVTGYEPAEAIGRTPRMLNSGEMPDAHFEALWETIRSGAIWEEEVVNRRRSGDLYHAHQTIAPVFDDGEIEAYVAIQSDVTDRKELERERERYRTIVDQLDDPIMIQDRDGRYVLVNDAVAEFADRSRDELLGKDEYLFMDDRTAARIEERKATVVDTEEPIEYEVTPSFDRHGEQATFSTKRYPYYGRTGDLAGTIAICRDVTTLKRREAKLRRYKRAIVGATDLICATDRNDSYLFANPQYCAYHDLEREDVTDRTLADVFEGPEYADIKERVDRALQGETVTYRMTRDHPTRGKRILDVRYYPLENGGAATGVVAVLRDVTDREERTRQLEVVDRILRHNLRNDLTVVRGHAERILEAESGQPVDAAETILEQVDDLLTTSEKSSNITEVLGTDPRRQPVDVGSLARRTAGSFDEDWPNARLEVTSPEHLTASATVHIHQALEELVRNALVHSDRESPAVELRVAGSETDVRLTVLDDGPGIPEMERDVLETGRAIGDLFHGSGLGLWLVYWIVHRSGGSIEVRDRDPRGTAVEITLPRVT